MNIRFLFLPVHAHFWINTSQFIENGSLFTQV